MIIRYGKANEQEIKELMEKDCVNTTKRNKNGDKNKYFQYYKSNTDVLRFNFVLSNGINFFVCETAGEFIAKFFNKDYKSLGITDEQWKYFMAEIRKTTDLNILETLVQESVNDKYDTFYTYNSEHPISVQEIIDETLEAIYICDNFDMFFRYLFYSKVIKNQEIIKVCANCGKYFSPRFRSDAKYCDNLSPQDPRVNCKTYCSQHNYCESIANSQAAMLYRKIYSRKNRRAQRHCDDDKYTEDYKTFARLGAEWKKKIAKQQATEQDFLNWLQSVDN